MCRACLVVDIHGPCPLSLNVQHHTGLLRTGGIYVRKRGHYLELLFHWNMHCLFHCQSYCPLHCSFHCPFPCTFCCPFHCPFCYSFRCFFRCLFHCLHVSLSHGGADTPSMVRPLLHGVGRSGFPHKSHKRESTATRTSLPLVAIRTPIA